MMNNKIMKTDMKILRKSSLGCDSKIPDGALKVLSIASFIIGYGLYFISVQIK
jgi:hypothetical protein